MGWVQCFLAFIVNCVSEETFFVLCIIIIADKRDVFCEFASILKNDSFNEDGFFRETVMFIEHFSL